MIKIVFVCTANICRSPMAEGMFRQIIEAGGLEESIFCLSFGIAAKEGKRPVKNAVLACREIGVDISGHRARNLSNIKDLEIFDAFVVMTGTHAYVLKQAGVPEEKLYLLGEEEIQDPYGGDLETFRQCRDQIRLQLQILLQRLRDYIPQ